LPSALVRHRPRARRHSAGALGRYTGIDAWHLRAGGPRRGRFHSGQRGGAGGARIARERLHAGRDRRASGLGRNDFPRRGLSARQVAYAEYYYRAHGGDVGFDPEFKAPSLDEKFRVHAKNATMAMVFGEADRIVAPTPFQAGLLPVAFRSRTAIIHEGVDTDLVRPAPNARLTVGGRVLDRSKPIITFINRRFEPLRGYHVFMRALPRVLAQVPDAEILLIGSEQPGGYGLPPPKGATWKQLFLDEVKDSLDPSRVHFTGPLPHGEMLAALSLSRAHVYYTYPFVLSWSLLEATASECLVIASDTAPVRDAIRSGENGLLFDFFDHDALAEALVEACRSPERFAPLRKAARETVIADFNRARCSAAWVDLLEGLCPSG